MSVDILQAFILIKMHKFAHKRSVLHVSAQITLSALCEKMYINELVSLVDGSDCTPDVMQALCREKWLTLTFDLLPWLDGL